MTIKSSRKNLFLIVFSYFSFLFIGGLCVFQSNQIANLAFFGVVVWIFATIFCLRWYIAVFRTITLTPDGVSVSIFRIHRFYSWNSITICYESYQDRLTYSKPQYKSAILIIPNGHRKPKRVQPLMYCIIFHPVSFLFLHFIEDVWHPDAPGVYAVRKEEFISKMIVWKILNADFLSKVQIKE